MLAFVHIPKTAGTTVNWMLRGTFGWHHCEVEPWHRRFRDFHVTAQDYRLAARWYPHLHSIAGHRVAPYSDLDQVRPDVTYFTMLHDPLKRCASFFQFLKQVHGKELDFETWVQRDSLKDQQTLKIAGVSDVDAAIRMLIDKHMFVGLTERFDESMVLFKSLFAPQLNIAYERRMVASDNTVARDLLSDKRSRELLAEANRQDLQLYEFVLNDLYERMRDFGPSLEQTVADCQLQKEPLNQFNVLSNRVYRNLVYKPVRSLYLARQKH